MKLERGNASPTNHVKELGIYPEAKGGIYKEVRERTSVIWFTLRRVTLAAVGGD